MLNAILNLKPATWTNESYTDKTYCRVAVVQGSKEFLDVASKVPGFAALLEFDPTIERVQHAFAYGQYVIRKCQLNKRQEQLQEYTIILKLQFAELGKALQTNLDNRSLEELREIRRLEEFHSIEDNKCVIVAKSLKENYDSLERNSEIYPEYVITFKKRE